MSTKSFCTKVVNWIKALWLWQKKSDTCKLTDIKSKYVAKSMLAYIEPVSLYRIVHGNKYTSEVFMQLLQNQVLFEMKVLLRVNILNLDGNKPAKTISFPKWDSEEAQNFNPKVLSDEDILGVCRKFNEYFLRRTNSKVYQKYKNQIENLENPGCFLASWDPKQFHKLCQNIINAAGFTEQEIKNMEFGSDKNASRNQQEFIPNLETKKEKNL